MTITPVTEVLPAPDLSTRDGCIEAAEMLASNFFQGMVEITYAWVYKYKHGTREELQQKLGKSERQMRKYVTELRKQGRVEESPKKREPILRPKRATNEKRGGPKRPLVENPEPLSDGADDVNLEETTVFNDMTEVLEDTMKERDELVLEVAMLRQQLANLKQNNDVSESQQSAELGSTSGLAPVEIYAGPEHGESSPPPIDYDWHGGMEVGSPECKDFNKVGRLVDEISEIVGRHYLKGLWGPREWESILGALGGPAAVANAQRRFRPGRKQVTG